MSAYERVIQQFDKTEKELKLRRLKAMQIVPVIRLLQLLG